MITLSSSLPHPACEALVFPICKLRISMQAAAPESLRGCLSSNASRRCIGILEKSLNISLELWNHQRPKASLERQPFLFLLECNLRPMHPCGVAYLCRVWLRSYSVAGIQLANLFSCHKVSSERFVPISINLNLYNLLQILSLYCTGTQVTVRSLKALHHWKSSSLKFIMILITLVTLFLQFRTLNCQALDHNGISLAEKVREISRLMLTPGTIDFQVAPCEFFLNGPPTSIAGDQVCLLSN